MQRMQDAMGICEILGEAGDYLKPFSSLSEYEELYHRFKTDPAMLKYCDHGGRHILWLPYSVQAREESEPSNITYYKSRERSS